MSANFEIKPWAIYYSAFDVGQKHCFSRVQTRADAETCLFQVKKQLPKNYAFEIVYESNVSNQ